MFNPTFPLFPTLFRTYDLRGHGDEELTSSFCFALGYIFAQMIHQDPDQPQGPIMVGRDCRLSGDRIFDALQTGLRYGGCDVVDLGEVATPMVYFALYTQKCSGGIMITGSHNPKHWNGLKMSIGKKSIYGDRIQEIYRAMLNFQQSPPLNFDHIRVERSQIHSSNFHSLIPI